MATQKTIEIISGKTTTDNEKLLLKVCKNDNEWLSPIGWKDYETSTLLPFRDEDGLVQVFFSDEYTGNLKPEDKLTITSYELGLEETLSWERARTLSTSTSTKKPEKSGGLLSKFTSGSKSELEPEAVLTESEKRVADAQRATEDYKAKMEAASAAQAEATRRAKEAARQAEEALRLEAERAAEMERAAKALEEAERLKQEEMRRIEEERRLEEERLAEEARRIEAARQRQLAAKREAERQAALKRFTGALDVTQNENRDMQKRLSALRSKANNLNEEEQQKDAKISKLKETLEKTSVTVETRFSAFEKKQVSLDGLAEEQAKLHTEADRLKGERQTLSLALNEAETEYSLAQKVVEEAVARAEAKRIALEAKRRKDTEILDLISETSEKLGHQSRLVSEASVKVQDLQSKLEAAQTKLSQTKLESETLEQEKLALNEAVQALEYDMDIAQSSLEALEKRENEYTRAIAHLEAGGSADDVDAALAMHTADLPDFSEETALENALHTALDAKAETKAPAPLASRPPAKLTFPVEEPSSKASFLASVTNNVRQSFSSKNTFMTLAVLLGGAAIVGASYVTYQSVTSEALVVKNDVPTPEDVASAVAEIKPADLEQADMPVSSELESENTELPTIDEPEKEASLETLIQEAKLEIVNPLDVKTETEAPSVEATKEPVKKSVEADVKPEPVKTTKSAPAAAPKIKPEPVLETTVNTASLEMSESKLTPPAFKIASKDVEVNTKEETETNYPELTLDIQNKLSQLGFYFGTVDGQLSDETKTAISEFKSIYDLPVNSDISGPFINQLNKAISERETALKMAAVTANIPSNVPPLKETAPVQTVAASPVTVPSAAPVIIAPAPEPVENTETVKLAEAPVTIKEVKPEAVPQDVIVEAKLKNKLSSTYPRKAERNNIWVNNVVIVEYDIDENGKTTNIRVVESEYDGRYASTFEDAAVKTISRAKYNPKTVNGEAVTSEGLQKRIVFRGE
jgi:TonB family protein